MKLKKIYDYRENTRFTHRCEDFATTSDRGRMDEIHLMISKIMASRIAGTGGNRKTIA